MAVYFNRISAEFLGLSPVQISITRPRNLPILKPFKLAARIKKIKKPRSMVMGDIFPSLMTKYSNFIAIPLTSIYNQITLSKVRPIMWKMEFVTAIPKTTNPDSFPDLRNISCTMFILPWGGGRLRVPSECPERQEGGGAAAICYVFMIV